MESASLSSLNNLTHLGLRAGVDMRPTLIRVLTDLYVQKLSHTAEEERHYTELALRLLDFVDVATRTAVADRLARHMAPPRRVVQRLAADLPKHPVAQRAKQLTKALTNPTEQPAASPVDARETSSAEPRIQQADRQEAVSRADERRDERPASPAPLIDPEIAGELTELFFAASAEERRLILLNLEIVVPTPPGQVQMLHELTIGQQLEHAALTRNREEFARHLARVLQIPRMQARRIVDDELGEPIVVVAKALALPREVVYRILLFANTAVGHSVARVHALAALFDEISKAAAEHVIAIWQGLHRGERTLPRHQPLLWNDEARARARTASTAVRRAPTSQRPNERRGAS